MYGNTFTIDVSKPFKNILKIYNNKLVCELSSGQTKVSL